MERNMLAENRKAVARCLRMIGSGAVRQPSVAMRAACQRAGLIAEEGAGLWTVTDIGRAWLARFDTGALGDSEIGRFRAQHLQLAQAQILRDGQAEAVTVDESESPLAWLARRKGRDGRTMIDSAQFQAGERLRSDFTCAQMTPRVTSNWSAPTGRAAPGGGAGEMTDAIVAARQRVTHALDTVGPEFSGILLDVCCFLQGLEQVERDRGWPARSAKIVLQLALDRLARHYGLRREMQGRAQSRIRSWASEAPPP